MKLSYLKTCIFLALVVTCSATAKKKRSSSIKYISVYTEADSQGIELAVCNDLDQSLIDKRTRSFEQEGEPWGHLANNKKELRVWLMDDIMAATDPKARSHFLPILRQVSAANQRKGTPFFTKEHSRITFSVDGWEGKKPGQFLFETEGKIFRGEGKHRGILKQVNITANKAFINANDIVELKKFQFTRNNNFGHSGLTYLYNYTGEIHVDKSNIQNIEKGGFKIAIVQSLYQTHFVDKYEMKRDYPHVTLMNGKVHNIETIQDKLEQNLYSIVIDVEKSAITSLPQNSSVVSIKFDIPILIHTTVLPPQKDADMLETGIPKNSKVYVNFLKRNASELLRGRFASDCLFEAGDRSFVAAGAIDDNVNKRVVEQRHTLNFAYHAFVSALTAAFSLFGLLVYLKIIASGLRPSRASESEGTRAAPEKNIDGDGEERETLFEKKNK